MEETENKKDLQQNRMNFSIRGKLSNFDKTQKYEQTTSKGGAMRVLTFNVESAEGHVHKMEIRCFQQEKVYFAKTEFDENKVRHNSIKAVNWNDRQKFNEEGFTAMNNIGYHYGKDENGKNLSKRILAFDAIPEILDIFKEGDSVSVNGTIEFQDFVTKNGGEGKAVKLIPQGIYFATKEVDFNDKDFVEKATFDGKIIVDEIEETGNKEMTIDSIFIGNRTFGRQSFIWKEDERIPEVHYEDFANFLKAIKKQKKYVALKTWGFLINGVAEAQEQEEEFEVMFGVKVPVKKSPNERRTASNFVREFLITGFDVEKTDVETYNEENVQEFIEKYITPKAQYGVTEESKELEADADDFAF